MLAEHGIVLNRDAYEVIQHWTALTERDLNEMMAEDAAKGVTSYVVFYRFPNGLPSWYVYSEEEFLEKYLPIAKIKTFTKLQKV